jgi:hypothetical protein
MVIEFDKLHWQTNEEPPSLSMTLPPSTRLQNGRCLVAPYGADTVVPPAVAVIEVGVLLVGVRHALAASMPERGLVGVSAKREGRRVLRTDTSNTGSRPCASSEWS